MKRLLLSATLLAALSWQPLPAQAKIPLDLRRGDEIGQECRPHSKNCVCDNDETGNGCVLRRAADIKSPARWVPLPRPHPSMAADIPQQYRGHWCETKWRTIYKRCTAGDMIVERDGWGVEDEGCTFQSVRSDKRYGGHRTVSVCQHVDSPDPPRRSEERWWLGSNGTRLQILETTSQVEPTQ